MGYALPPGTIVATQAWSMHRDASIFPSPSTFLPDRWLETSSPDNTERLMAMQQHFMPFGTGSRICGGQNLAMIMLRVTVAAIARNFDVVAPVETNDRSMDVKDSFVSVCPPFPLNLLLMLFARSFFLPPWSANSASAPALNATNDPRTRLRHIFFHSSRYRSASFYALLICSFNLWMYINRRHLPAFSSLFYFFSVPSGVPLFWTLTDWFCACGGEVILRIYNCEERIVMSGSSVLPMREMQSEFRALRPEA
jgi:hypothetical protein